MAEMADRGPLLGHRVLCVGSSRGAALACGLLRSQGASPIVVELEAGAPGEARRLVGAAAAATYRVGADGGAPLELEELLAVAEVVIDPRPADAPAPPGWSGPELRSRCGPEAVYCRLPPFSSQDGQWRSRPASDLLLAAMTGAWYREEDDTPTFTPLPVSACFGALAGALGVAAGLLARERYGQGQQIEVAELDATLLAAGARALLVNGEPAADRPSDPWAGPYRCGDGRWIWMNLATPKAVRRFAAEVGTLERWEREGLLGAADLGASSPGRAELRRELAALFMERPAWAWDELAVDLGVAITAIRTPEQVRPCARCGAAGTALDAELHAAFRDERTVDVRERATAPGAAPGAGAWSKVRAPAGAWALTPQGAASGATLPLAGVRVLDLTQMLAGPFAGRLLADLGAQVVKINDPNEEGAGYRWHENRYHTDVNRGKASVLVDLSRPEGRAVAEQLVADADVVLENLRSDAARRLGVDGAALRRLAPGLCHAHISAFSLESRWDAPGYEPNGQAIAGLMGWNRATGVPRLQPFPVNDYGTGLLAAFGVTLALYHQLRGGRPCDVGASLSRTAFYFARATAGASGTEPTTHLWHLRDGWIVVDGPVEAAAALGVGVAGGEGATSEDEWRAALRRLDGDEVLAELASAGFVATRLRSTPSLARRPELAERGQFATRRYTDDYEVTAVGNPIIVNGAPLHRGLWVARPGKDGPAVLEALGRSPRAVEQLLADGVVAIG